MANSPKVGEASNSPKVGEASNSPDYGPPKEGETEEEYQRRTRNVGPGSPDYGPPKEGETEEEYQKRLRYTRSDSPDYGPPKSSEYTFEPRSPDEPPPILENPPDSKKFSTIPFDYSKLESEQEQPAKPNIMIGSKVKLATEEDSAKEYIVKQLLDNDRAIIKSGEDTKEVSIIDLEKVRAEPEFFTFDIPDVKKGEGKDDELKMISINNNSNENSNEQNGGGNDDENLLDFDGQLTSIDLDSLI